jgi:hypothetical protein
MSEPLPIAYLRIWAQKNQSVVHIERKTSDKYQITKDGVMLAMADGTLAPVNVRQIFPIINRYPSLQISDLELKGSTNTKQFHMLAMKPEDKLSQKLLSFEQVRDEIESYLSLLMHLDSLQLYVAIRAYESQLVGLPHVTRIAGMLTPNTSMGTLILQQNLCTWEELLAVCLDLKRPAPRVKGQAERAVTVAEFELVGEILVSLGRLTRTQLLQAVATKSTGDKPLGEILVQIGACTADDIDSAVRTQTDMRTTDYGSMGMLGDVLTENGIVRREDVFEALRMQKIARQRLDGILISMGLCTADHIQEFRWRCQGGVSETGDINEEKLAEWVLMSNFCSPRELEEALRLQKRGRQLLGELLVALKRCTEHDVQRALQVQRDRRSAKPGEPERLGELLVAKRIVSERDLETAAAIQFKGRERLGSALVNVGACTEEDFRKALELQFSWRQSTKQREDKLGEELLKEGYISEANLAKALEINSRSGKPLGQILIEQGSCPPEIVIDTLIRRDERRRSAFNMLLKQYAPMMPPRRDESLRARAMASSRPPEESDEKAGLVQKVSSWFFKKPEK